MAIPKSVILNSSGCICIVAMGAFTETNLNMDRKSLLC